MKFDEITNRDERDEVVRLFANWLKPYTHKVIVEVLAKQDEILGNVYAMGLLRELYERSEKESHDFCDSIDNLLGKDYEVFKEYDPHNHPLTHAGSYRDILYDMYIR